MVICWGGVKLGLKRSMFYFITYFYLLTDLVQIFTFGVSERVSCYIEKGCHEIKWFGSIIKKSCKINIYKFKSVAIGNLLLAGRTVKKRYKLVE